MQRDVGNEVIVAIVAIGVLAFVVMFAVILSLSGAGQGGATTTQQAAVATVSNTPIETIVTATETLAATTSATTAIVLSSTPRPPVAVTVTPRQPTATEPPPSSTPTEVPPSATVTPVPPTAVPTQRPSNTAVVSTAAQVKPTTPSPTNTAQPSNTPSRTPTPTYTPTATTVPSRTPTATYTLTATTVPSRTPTPTLTASATFTPTRTPVPTNTPTRTPRPTETSGIRPTPTGTRTAIPPVLDLTCTPQAGWYSYTVRSGETLSMIARAVGASVNTLQRANCLQDINQIYAGQNILVPRLPVEPPALPGVTPGSDLAVEGCTAPSTQITNLTAGQLIGGTFNVRGTASAPNFQYYKIEVRPDFASVFNFFSRSETPVENGVLATIDPAIFGRGLHWIKLTVIADVYQPPCVIPVIFQ